MLFARFNSVVSRYGASGDIVLLPSLTAASPLANASEKLPRLRVQFYLFRTCTVRSFQRRPVN